MTHELFLALLGFASMAMANDPAPHGGGHGAEGAAPNLLDINFFGALWVVIIFIVLLVVLYPTAWKNVLAGLKAREERIRNDIAEAEGASQSDLVRITGVDRSTLAEMMARMESRGLIVRAAAADDGRAKSVRLTAMGRRKLDLGVPAIRVVDRALLAAVSTPRRAAFQAILSELSDAADREHVATEQAERGARKTAAPAVRSKPKAKKAKAVKKPVRRKAR